MIGNRLMNKRSFMKTILITGINGFLGSHLAKRLSDRYNIIGLEHSIENLFRLKDHSFRVYATENSYWYKLFEDYDIDIIIHAATLYGRNNEDINHVAETNLFMPFRLLDEAIKKEISVFINIDTVLDRFVNTYALTKRHFQEWLFFRKSEIKVINLQLEHFYGPGCSNTNFIIAISNRLRNNEKVIDLTSGEQMRNFIYYEDVLDAFEVVLNNINSIAENFKQYEVGSGELISIKELVLKMKQLLGSTSILNFGAIPQRLNELKVTNTDISEISKLGWRPKFKISDGLQTTIL